MPRKQIKRNFEYHIVDIQSPLGMVKVLFYNDDPETPWFIGVNIAELLNYKRPDYAIRYINSINKKKELIPYNQLRYNDPLNNRAVVPTKIFTTTIINESGLYELILKSRIKGAVQDFKLWVTNEVLPSIRKTGKYIDSEGKYGKLMSGIIDSRKVGIAVRKGLLEMMYDNDYTPNLVAIETNRIYLAIFGKTAAQLKAERGLDPGTNDSQLRNEFTKYALTWIYSCETNVAIILSVPCSYEYHVEQLDKLYYSYAYNSPFNTMSRVCDITGEIINPFKYKEGYYNGEKLYVPVKYIPQNE